MQPFLFSPNPCFDGKEAEKEGEFVHYGGNAKTVVLSVDKGGF